LHSIKSLLFDGLNILVGKSRRCWPPRH
jgi:hypothetical protein